MSYNLISFQGAGTEVFYYNGTASPPLMVGDPVTDIPNTSLPIQYGWNARTDVDGSTWSRIYSPDGLSSPPGDIIESMVYMREAFLIIDGKEVYLSESNSIRAHVAEPVANNTICCDQTVTGLATPAIITGSVATGGSGTLHYSWSASTDGSTWTLPTNGTYIDNGVSFRPEAGVRGKVYYRRIAYDNSPSNIAGGRMTSNVVTVIYNNDIPVGSTITNAFKTSSFDNNCGEFIQTVNSMNGNFVNNYGSSGNDVYFQFTVTGNTTIGFVACASSVPTNFYLFDANFNPKAMSYTQNYCYQSVNLSPGTYYIMIEGNGSLRLHIGTYVYSDCVDGYDTGPFNPPSGFTSSGIEVFPNPATDNVQIALSDETDTEAKSVVIYNRNNVAVKRFETHENTLQISVADLPSDIYVIDIVTRKESRKQRLVVK